MYILEVLPPHVHPDGDPLCGVVPLLRLHTIKERSGVDLFTKCYFNHLKLLYVLPVYLLGKV
jgi:hypothetical protein